MALPPDFAQYIDVNSPTWKIIKLWLEDKKVIKTDLLIAEDSHDKSNRIRGSLQFINEILALEKAALASANGR